MSDINQGVPSMNLNTPSHPVALSSEIADWTDEIGSPRDSDLESTKITRRGIDAETAAQVQKEIAETRESLGGEDMDIFGADLTGFKFFHKNLKKKVFHFNFFPCTSWDFLFF